MAVNDEAAGDGLGRRATRSLMWVALEKWTGRIVSLALLAVLTRLLAPEAFGLVSTATVFIAFFSVLVDAGFAKALVRQPTLATKDADTAFWTSVVLGVVLYAVLFAAAPLIATWFDSPQLAPVLRMLGILLPLASLSSTPVALMERDLKFRVLALRSLLGAVVGALVAIPMAVLGYGIWALVVNTVVTQAVATIALWVASGWWPRFRYSLDSLRSLTSVGLGSLGVELLSVTQANLDKLLIGAVAGQEALGYYFIAQRALNILAEMLTSIIGRVSLTSFAKAQTDPERLNRMLRRFTLLAAAVGIGAFGISAILAPQLIQLAFGDGWEDSVLIYRILAASAAIAAISSFDGSLLLAVGRPGGALGLALGQSVWGIALLILAIPFGPVAIAASRTIRALTYFPVRLVALRRMAQIAVGPYLAQLARAVAAFIPAGVALWAFEVTLGDIWHPLAVGVVGGGLAALVYAALLWLTMSAENRAFVVSVVARRGGRAPEER